MGAKVSYNSKVEVLRVGTLYVNLIRTSTILVGLFMLQYRLQMEVSQTIVITSVRVMVSIWESHIFGFLADVDILG